MNDKIGPDIVEIFQLIKEKISSVNRPTILGINGYDAAGKTKFAELFQFWLQKAGLNCQIIHLDDFHNNLAKRREGETENQAYIDNAFNLELVASLLKKIKQDQHLDQQLTLLDLKTDAYSLRRHYQISSNSIILLEGVLLFRPPINQYLDFKIFLQASVDTLLARNIARSDRSDPIAIEKRYREKYLKIQDWYNDTYHPAKIADIVIDNEDYNYPQIISS